MIRIGDRVESVDGSDFGTVETFEEGRMGRLPVVRWKRLGGELALSYPSDLRKISTETYQRRLANL